MPDALLLPDLIGALPLPTLAIDRNERIVAMNPAAQDLLGAGLQGRNFVTGLRQPALVDAVEPRGVDDDIVEADFEDLDDNKRAS